MISDKVFTVFAIFYSNSVNIPNSDEGRALYDHGHGTTQKCDASGDFILFLIEIFLQCGFRWVYPLPS